MGRPFQISILILSLLFALSTISLTASHASSSPTQPEQYNPEQILSHDTPPSALAETVVTMSRTLAMTGQYEKAKEICRETLKKLPEDPRIGCQLAELLIGTGRSDEALIILDGISNTSNPSVRALVQYGKLLQNRGLRHESLPYLKKAISQYNIGLVNDAEDLAMIGAAYWLLGLFQDANRVFREAVNRDPENLEAQLLWGDLFLEKYNIAEARESYSKVLDRNRKYIPALVGIAKTLNGIAAKEVLDGALEINPLEPSILEAFADMAIEDDKFDEAENYLEKALSLNATSMNALTLLAAIAFLKDDYRAFENYRETVLQFCPGSGRFYSRIAEICGRKYRFREAVDLARRSVEIDPQNWQAFNILGVNLLRLGKEEEGRSSLEQAFEKDPFNFWTVNMLRILDRMDHFERRETAHFVVRMHREDADILWPNLEPFLEECWDTLTKKYNFVPEGPVLVEIFNDKEDFSVRTSGLPGIGPLLGVCFGNVITLVSPNAMSPPCSQNWQEIIWHEFMHVITLQMTRNRIPRWLTEGISVFEEEQGRTEWGRKQDLVLIKAVQEDGLIGLKNLNEGFSKAESVEAIHFAYYQSSLVVEFIVEKYGYEVLQALIYEYRSVEEIHDIFQKVFHVSSESFEEAFLSWIHDRIERLDLFIPKAEVKVPSLPGAGYTGSAIQPIEPTTSEEVAETYRKRVEANPRDFQAQLQLGIIFYNGKDYDSAIKHLNKAIDMLPEDSASHGPRSILANIYKDMGNEEAMLRELEALVKKQQHDFNACQRLAQKARNGNDLLKAVYYLERAIAVNPYHGDIHRMLAEVSMEQAHYEKAIKEYGILIHIDRTDPVAAQTDLANAFLLAGRKIEAKHSALMALEIAPNYERAQEILLGSLEP